MQFLKTSLSLFFAFVVFFASAGNTFGQQEIVTIQPEKPLQGETVTIVYHTDGPDAKLAKADSMKLIFSYAPYQFSQPDEFEMSRSEEGWTAEVPLSEQFKFATFYFKSGEKVDKNKEGQDYQFFAFKNGVPVEDAFITEASLVESRYEEVDKTIQNDIKAHLFAKALAIHPNNYKVLIEWYGFLFEQTYVDSAKVKALAYQTIENKLDENPGSWNTVRLVKYGYRLIGEKAKGDSIEQAMIEKYPQSDIAMVDLYSSANEQKDEQEKIQMLQKYVNADYERSFINRLYSEFALETLFEYYAGQGDVEMMEMYLNRYLNPERPAVNKLISSKHYKKVARTIAENTDLYEQALDYAQKALDRTDNEPAAAAATIYGRKARALDAEREKELLTGRKSEILATLGFIYTKMGEYDKAAEQLTAAQKLSDDDGRILKDLGNLYTVTEQPQKAFKIYRQLLLKKPFDEDLQGQLKECYIALQGSSDGFENEISQIANEWRDETKAEFRDELMDKEPPSLASVTDLQGNVLDLSTLKNKVVVVDFWATWCGPCMSAFPYVQKVYEKYKNNEDIKFIILNSAWQNTVEDAIKWTKEGEYAENDYTFPLYYDKDSKVTTAFGVRGIPTTFILGKNGNIKFKHVGYPGPLLEQKLALRIEMALNGAEKADE